MEQNAIFTDLPSRVVGGFVPARGVGEGWVPVDWETAEARGVGLAAGCRSGARELTLDLGLTGPHTLYLALALEGSALRSWLDGEPGDREFITGHSTYGPQECRLHTADLTGRRLHVALKDDKQARGAFLVYVRAVPERRPHRNARNLIATNDGISWIDVYGLTSERDVARCFTPFRDSDFLRILWGPGAGDIAWSHDTRVGTWMAADSIHDLGGQKELRPDVRPHVLAAAVANARDVGLEIQFYLRMEGFDMPFPYDQAPSRFYAEHRGWSCRDEFGDEILRLSYAYPHVQDHMLAYYEELLEYRPDGLCFAFNRGLPMMICEEPVLAECERRRGRRPRLPEEVDSEAMIEARGALMTAFLLRVKKLLDSRGLAFSCIVKADEAVNRAWGVDLAALTERGVFESICIHNTGPCVGGGDCLIHESPSWPFWRALRDSGRVKLYPSGWNGSYDHKETARFLRDDIFGRRFVGGFFWDTEHYYTNPYNWHVIRQGGTPKHLEGTVTGRIPEPKIIPFTRVRGVKLGRYNPMMTA